MVVSDRRKRDVETGLRGVSDGKARFVLVIAEDIVLHSIKSVRGDPVGTSRNHFTNEVRLALIVVDIEHVLAPEPRERISDQAATTCVIEVYVLLVVGTALFGIAGVYVANRFLAHGVQRTHGPRGVKEIIRS